MGWFRPSFECGCCSCSCPVYDGGGNPTFHPFSRFNGPIGLKLEISGLAAQYSSTHSYVISFNKVAVVSHQQTGFDAINGTYIWDVGTSRGGCFYPNPKDVQNPSFPVTDSITSFTINHSSVRKIYDGCVLDSTDEYDLTSTVEIEVSGTENPYGVELTLETNDSLNTPYLGGTMIAATAQFLFCEHDFRASDYPSPVGSEPVIRGYYFQNDHGTSYRGLYTNTTPVCGNSVDGEPQPRFLGSFSAELIEL